MLGDIGQVALGIIGADAAGNAAVLGKRVFQFEADDAVLPLCGGVGAAPVGQNLERFLAIEIVPVDDGERLPDDIGGHEHGVGGAPGFYTLGIQGETGGNLGEFLGDENELQRCPVHGFHAFVFLLHVGFHLVLERLADNIDHLAETGGYGVVDGIINNGLSVGAQAIHLFQATITAAHTGSQDKQGRFHHFIIF